MDLRDKYGEDYYRKLGKKSSKALTQGRTLEQKAAQAEWARQARKKQEQAPGFWDNMAKLNRERTARRREERDRYKELCSKPLLPEKRAPEKPPEALDSSEWYD